ncbi:stretch-activated Ca2+-permeable channel component-domain-containing protein [Boletus edulis]|nr:stretch-activated Ca2+-permeable channel component-domain-containing protein [Boletus edulis]
MLFLLPLLVLAVDAQQPLTLNSINTFTTSTSLFDLPASSQLTVSVAIMLPSVVPGSGGGADVFEIQLTDGSGQWSGSAPSGGLLSCPRYLEQGSFQISVSDNANLPAPDIPSSIPNFTLVIAPTSAQLSSLPQTACALLNTSSTVSIAGNDPWLRSSEGWRSQWLVDGLTPSTNYTAYVIQDVFKVSGPIYFATKSASFQCPLVYSLPYCPSIAYAMPLPPPPSRTFGYNATSLPDSITLPLLQYMNNFTTMLTTFACGRDLYSPLQTCADCQTHYRTWLCSVSFPRCSEQAPGNNSTAASSSSLGTAAQVPLSALQPQSSGSPSRSSNFPNATYNYSSLLPCLETCNAVDRACPYFLGIKCPTTKFNAAASYGVGFIDSGDGDEIGNGVTGLAQDRWGNVWCNGN